MAFATALLVMLLATPFAFTNAQTTVDWTLGKDYSTYSTQSFKPADTILFNYDSTQHNVLVVNKNDYDNCNTGNALQTFTDGKTTITLKQGPMYFICGIPGHCLAGMKLQANTAATSVSSKPTTTKLTPAAAPSMMRSIPTAVSGPATSPAPSPTNGISGAVGLSSAGHLMFGLPLVFGVLFGLML